MYVGIGILVLGFSGPACRRQVPPFLTGSAVTLFPATGYRLLATGSRLLAPGYLSPFPGLPAEGRFQVPAFSFTGPPGRAFLKFLKKIGRLGLPQGII